MLLTKIKLGPKRIVLCVFQILTAIQVYSAHLPSVGLLLVHCSQMTSYSLLVQYPSPKKLSSMHHVLNHVIRIKYKFGNNG